MIRLFGILLLSTLIATPHADAATRARGTANTSGPTQPVARGVQNTTTTTNNGGTSAARAARRAPNAAAPQQKTTAARAATSQPKQTVAARAATPQKARAGTTQKAVNTGTKVAAATANTVGAECQNKFNGCMDSLCMLENVSGGRCQCSARFDELTQQWNEIQKQDEKSYKLATLGVEAIETNIDANTLQNAGRQKSGGLDLSTWNTNTDDIDDALAYSDALTGKTGAALQSAAANLCIERIPECAATKQTLVQMYSAKIRSDCAAFENAIKQARIESDAKLAAAEKALREAAVGQIRSANKYDLGQCTLEFKKCMISTGGCGEDFKGCVGIAAAENMTTRVGESNISKTYDIKGASTKISIAASSYDTLDSKRPLCESVLNQCQSVRDQVWPAFMREIGPTIKTAELRAESDMRTACISNISDCFQKACKDTMDPNNPDGSYDMCLSRPETVRSLCKVQIDPCVATEPLILEYVYAKLASMRVDSCTTEVKQCLQSDDRCGKDYTQCVGLDTDTIIKMCPYDKLTGCQKVYQDTDIRGDAVYDELATMVQGLMINIDNNMLDYCQAALDESMIKVCGDTTNCNSIITDDTIGAGSLDYKICSYSQDASGGTIIDYNDCVANVDSIPDTALGRVEGSTTGELGPTVPIMGVLGGTIFWSAIQPDNDGKLPDTAEYFTTSGATDIIPEKKKQIEQEITRIQTAINNAVETIEADPTVKYCMTGREVPGMKDKPIGNKNNPRFPKLTKQIRTLIAAQALSAARSNYIQKYDKLYEQQMKDYVTIAERQAEIKGENAKDIRREAARISCISLADAASLPMSPPPPNGWGAWLVVGIVVVASIVVSVLTLGSGTVLAAGATAAVAKAMLGVGIGVHAAVNAAIITVNTAIIASATAAASAIAAGISTAATQSNGGNTANVARELTGHHELNQWNYKQIIDTTFDWDSLNCHKCVKTTKCIKQSYPLFGSPKCKQWEPSETEDCTDTQF